MDEKKVIMDLFERLGITNDELPSYEDPETFAQGFKKCSVLKDIPIVYSISTNGQNNAGLDKQKERGH